MIFFLAVFSHLAVLIFVSFPAALIMASFIRARFLRERQATSIVIGGFKFFRHSRSLVGNRIQEWTCAKKYKLKCSVSAVTIDGVVVSSSGLHCHP